MITVMQAKQFGTGPLTELTGYITEVQPMKRMGRGMSQGFKLSDSQGQEYMFGNADDYQDLTPYLNQEVVFTATDSNSIIREDKPNKTRPGYFWKNIKIYNTATIAYATPGAVPPPPVTIRNPPPPPSPPAANGRPTFQRGAPPARPAPAFQRPPSPPPTVINGQKVGMVIKEALAIMTKGEFSPDDPEFWIAAHRYASQMIYISNRLEAGDLAPEVQYSPDPAHEFNKKVQHLVPQNPEGPGPDDVGPDDVPY